MPIPETDKSGEKEARSHCKSFCDKAKIDKGCVGIEIT
jgi:hypothetical protein